jgi:hypothetical protein
MPPLCWSINTVPARKKIDEDQTIGRSQGGLSTKVYVLVDALGNPLKIVLTAGQVHNLIGADAFPPAMKAKNFLTDKTYDADKQAIGPLTAADQTVVIPPKRNHLAP